MSEEEVAMIRYMMCTFSILFLLYVCLLRADLLKAQASSLQTENENLFKTLQSTHSIPPDQMEKVRKIFSQSGFIGQGNPAVTKHAATKAECEAKLKKASVTYDNPEFEKICGGKYMAPLYNSKKEKKEDSKTCIDQFEFPDIPCEYPVVWVRAKEAVQICEAIGKRLCDAHEWEGGCAGSLEEPDYQFELAKGTSPNNAIERMRLIHNKNQSTKKVWAYGPNYRTGICGGTSFKHKECNGGNWKSCGSNTFPAGYFPDCKSPLQVYDQHGNAAEHMNLPLKESEMASKGSKEYGYTEMKGSWFIFDSFKAHEDFCRWRAPYWHGSRVMDKESHHNYHLGFRCCKDIPQK